MLFNLFGYNPRKFEEYIGKKFVTKSGSVYLVDKNGILYKNQENKNIKVSMLAGIKDEKELNIQIYYLSGFTGPENRKALEKLIKRHGKRPEQGLRLILSLTEESAEKLGRNAYHTTTLTEILE